MFLRRVPRWLFLRSNRWIDIKMMTNEIRVHFGSFISTPSKLINILSKESQQLLLLLRRQLKSTWKYLSTSISIITFSSSSHLTPSATMSEDVSISFDCYKALSKVAEDSPSDWCLIAATRYCLTSNQLLNLVSWGILHFQMQSWRDSLHGMKPRPCHDSSIGGIRVNHNEISFKNFWPYLNR